MTLRELLALAEARSRAEWGRTAALMALVANCHRDPKKTRAFRPGDFDPFVRRAASAQVGIEVLKDVFIDGKYPGHGCPGAVM